VSNLTQLSLDVCQISFVVVAACSQWLAVDMSIHIA
jgi:hypothetical protein